MFSLRRVARPRCLWSAPMEMARFTWSLHGMCGRAGALALEPSCRAGSGSASFSTE